MSYKLFQGKLPKPDKPSESNKLLSVGPKGLVCTILLFSVIFVSGMVHASARTETIVGYELPPGQYTLTRAGDFDRFTNHVDGYSLLVPAGMSVDMTLSEVGAFLENEDIRIEIFRQRVTRYGKASYLKHSRFFLDNTADHTTNLIKTETIGAHETAIASWSRRSLARIENDKNHYISFNIGRGSYVYNIFVKSSSPIYGLGGFDYLVESLRFEQATAPPFVRRTIAANIADRGWNDETEKFFIEYFGPQAHLRWGLFEPTLSGFDFSRLFEYEEFFEYEFKFLLNYSEVENTTRHPNLMRRLETALEHGRVLVLTLQTPLGGLPDGSKQVYRMLDGEYDDFLRHYAQTIADFGHPVLFRPGNEMNGDWCDYSAFHLSKDTEIFRQWYRYIYSFFEETGANANTIWVWNPNGQSFPPYNWNHELMYYPGDEFVDIVGMTMYNTGTFYARVGETWQEFYQLYDALYARYTKVYAQPLMITEFASASMGGDKNQWVRDMFLHIKNYPTLRVAIWWNGVDFDAYGNISRSYILNESPELMNIFRENFSSRSFLPSVPMDASVLLDGMPLEFDAPLQSVGGRTFVPFRVMLEALDAKVTWDTEARHVTASRDDTEISLTIGSSRAFVNGEPVTLEVAPREISGRTFVPLRFISEALGVSVYWNSATSTVEITSKIPPSNIAEEFTLSVYLSVD